MATAKSAVAKSAAAKKNYTVNATIRGDVTLDIAASDWTDALNQALNLKFEDFVSANGDINDSNKPEITGLWTVAD